jgi:hypothetical protein
MERSGGLAWGRGRPARFGPCDCNEARRLAIVGRPRAGGTPAPPEWWTGLTTTVPHEPNAPLPTACPLSQRPLACVVDHPARASTRPWTWRPPSCPARPTDLRTTVFSSS